MNWILVILLVLLIFFLWNRHEQRKNLRRTSETLKRNWGLPKAENTFSFHLISKYFDHTLDCNTSFHIISDRTAKDLDFDEVFKIIDRTSSKIGQQFLYYKMRSIGSKQDLEQFKTLVHRFENDEALRLKTQLQLSRLNTSASYYFESLITSKPIKKPKALRLVYGLSFLSLTLIILSFINPIFIIFWIPVFATNIVFHYKNKWNISEYLDGVTQLSRTLTASQVISRYPELESLFKDLGFIKKIEQIKLKTEFISFEKNLNNEFATVFWMISEFIKIFFNIEYIVFYSFIDSINHNKEALNAMFQFIGTIDCAISTASLKAGSIQTCHPEFVDHKKISVCDIIHPLLKDCVSNNLNLIDNSLLLTGSNMSGKTTFIRSVAINSILAQTLNICFAKSYAAPFFKIYSSIRINDDVLENTSYYLEEVLTIKNLVDASKSENPCLFVLDEIFKGTNTRERIAGGKAILSYLNKGPHIVMVSTHDIELTDLLGDDHYQLYHFSEQIENETLCFDHKLKPGQLKTRNAIKILELYKYPDEIIQDALSTELNFDMPKV